MLNSDEVIVNGQFLRISKEGIVNYFKVFFRRCGNHRTLTHGAWSLGPCVREVTLECK
jgi:hypothetical protein